MYVNATIFARISVAYMDVGTWFLSGIKNRKFATNSQLLGTQTCLDSRKTYDIDKIIYQSADSFYSYIHYPEFRLFN